MKNKESYVFWEMAHKLISEHGYRIIQLFENQKELWLEKLENKNAPVVRMLLENIDWGNVMQRDIEFTAANGESVRKQLGRHKLDVVNIYISEFPPVDDYEFRLKYPFVFADKNKTTVHSYLIAAGVIETNLEKLSNQLGKDISISIQDEYTEQDVYLEKKAALDYAINRVKRERGLLQNSKPLFTYLFIFLQVAMFLWLQWNGGSTNSSTLIKYGAKVNQLIYEGDYWRFITPVFLHIGLLHLVMNTLALYYLGTVVERIYGRVRFLFIYLFAGFTGVISSFIFSPNLSAGASGAIFGCFGALLYFGATNRKLFFKTMGLNVIIVLIINLVFGFTASGIDNAGHLGGLAGGFLAAGIVHLPKKRNGLRQVACLILTAIVVWGSLSYGFSATAQTQDEDTVIVLAQDYIKQDQYQKAHDVLRKYESTAEDSSERTYFLLSYVEIKQGNLASAKSHLKRAIELDPNFHEAYFNLALINLEQKELGQAKINAQKAADLKPKQQEYSDLVNEINEQLQSSGAGE
ncbi:rhomboid family intramembrane serine protease [Neobacillus dielmonensis]|uniref:rhomboid family intramembrane serine protease n=1 Tax=Neobacillus dielmonensis TaxID=1347369 RepID=UPI0005A60C45|nr:rhomboid family intramembrane serine protease [Neobacillus dielmonensis]